MKTQSNFTNHIILSGITVSMLFSPLMALPSGGKFTHGTSGTITSNGNNMNINGLGQNSVIQWGGGFNIANGEKVEFGGNSKNYLNIAHGAGKSTIAGILNAGGNNVFLINPNGVIITKTGRIDANRFVASTSTLNNADYENFFKMGSNFSPVFKGDKLGNVVNMGNIDVKENLILQGNKIILKAEADKGTLNQIKAGNKIHLDANEIYADISTVKTPSIETSHANKGDLYLSAMGYYFNPERTYNEFDNISNLNKSYKNYVDIGSVQDWWYFVKGWNDNKKGFRETANGYRLTNDIDFKGENYANYCIDGQCTNMIIGYDNEKVFNKNFDGQGFSLKNIKIDFTAEPNRDKEDHVYVGVFGYVKDSTIKDFRVDYGMNSINVNNVDYVGGVFGKTENNTISQIELKNISDITSIGRNKGLFFIGGFAGLAGGNFSDISLYTIKNIRAEKGQSSLNVGGFAGNVRGNFEKISIKNIDNIIVKGNPNLPAFVGGFAGQLYSGNYIRDIKMEDVKNIDVTSSGSFANVGGFIGEIGSKNAKLSNIYIKNLESIKVDNKKQQGVAYVGGFAGKNYSANLENIALEGKINIDVKSTDSIYIGGFLGCNGANSWGCSNSGGSIKNVSLYFKEGSSINAKSYQNKTVNTDLFVANKVGINNSNTVYHYANDFGGFSTSGASEVSYINNDKYSEFTSKIPSITDPTKPSEVSRVDLDNDVFLDNEDLYEDIINDEIISDLKKYLAINANSDLKKLLEAYGNLTDRKSKVQFIAEFLLDDRYDDKTSEAEKLMQSMDFLLAYSQNNKIDSKFKEGVQDKFNSLKQDAKNHYDITIANKDKLIGFIRDLQSKVENINDLKDKYNKENYQKQIDELATRYNIIVSIINSNKNLSEDLLNNFYRELSSISSKIENLMFLAQLDKNKSDISIDDFESLKAKANQYEYFTLNGNFDKVSNVKIPILDSIKDSENGGGGEIEIPDKPIDPVEPPSNDSDNSLVFEQTASLNSIGSKTLEEEEDKNDIEEASPMQKGKICIVSDNSKTMNPCIVSGM
ncbi:filamentous hemagglutinin N-terminal domain-containing protein [Campylobacter sp. RKI_CA19_01116]|uniref:two-partner secretion domain-containing protein n=1 Tax=Campylobacter sp. RKI_CA19_01116 TaxID=2911625 RepID=UPI0021E7DFA7|nr:filamentous hemagglutinin N-terminal domain-containing protein [Campylobacter sp. RKI_CA19_01116]MCV3397638.1 filamentous hemagglutinin N-terminal domain-containing protein [Campylobacter sp. RKI_CA19_01116]